MSSLTDTAEQQSMNWLTGNTATAPVLPLMVRLMTANGDDTTAGTECTGDNYAPKSAAFTVTGNTASNSAAVTYGVLDSAASRTITGFEVWDSAATPVRWWHAPLTGGNLVVAAGEPCEFQAGNLTLSQD